MFDHAAAPADIAAFPLDPDQISRRIDRLNAEVDFFRRLHIAAIHLRALQSLDEREKSQKEAPDARH